MNRRIEYVQPTAFESLGRNGRMTTLGCVVRDHEFRDPNDYMVSILPVNSRGEIGRAEVTVTAEAAGDVGAAFIEVFCRNATPEARQALLRRLETICAGQPDPNYQQDAPGVLPYR